MPLWLRPEHETGLSTRNGGFREHAHARFGVSRLDCHGACPLRAQPGVVLRFKCDAECATPRRLRSDLEDAKRREQNLEAEMQAARVLFKGVGVFADITIFYAPGTELCR
jgi:hypothetical protein